MTKSNISYIIFGGYYNNEDDDTLYEHTSETKALYDAALLNTYNGPLANNENVLNGVCFNDKGKPMAEWLINGDTKYIEIKQ